MKRPPNFSLFFLLAFAWTSVASSQDVASKACDAFQKLVIPEQAKPTLDQAAALGPCDGFALYYESTARNRFEKARYCLLARLGEFRDGAGTLRATSIQASISGGATDPADLRPDEGMVLAMLFANGEGTRRDPTAAKSLVCHFGFSSQQANVDALPAMLHSLDIGGRIDLCGKDEADQGREVWFTCSGLRVSQAAKRIDQKQESLLRSLSIAQRKAFEQLKRSWQVLAKAEFESFAFDCAGGTGCGVYVEQDDLAMQQLWLAKLDIVSSGTLPSNLPTLADCPRLDKQLNAVYQGRLSDNTSLEENSPQVGVNATVTPLRKAQRAWQAYREAWIALAHQLWPAIQADRWRGWLAAEWIDHLKNS